MSLGYEVTVDDLWVVAQAHKLDCSEKALEELFERLDLATIEQGIYFYTSQEDQAQSMLDDIENQLIEMGLIETAKLFFAPDSIDAEFEEN